MFEKVNPSHPDKIADRIAGAIVDLAYKREANPKVAVEVLLGHGRCFVIIESSLLFTESDIEPIIRRIAGDLHLTLVSTRQDNILAENQRKKHRCGDNGIFKGMPITEEQELLSHYAKEHLYKRFPSDGKYILADEELIICQSNAKTEEIAKEFNARINPLGEWTGGIYVDSGATNRKLGSDMGDAVTGGGLHGKDLSKADVSVNIYAHLKAQKEQRPIELYCAIGDEYVDGKPYDEIVKIAREYINNIGGFEKFAEWGMI